MPKFGALRDPHSCIEGVAKYPWVLFPLIDWPVALSGLAIRLPNLLDFTPWSRWRALRAQVLSPCSLVALGFLSVTDISNLAICLVLLCVPGRAGGDFYMCPCVAQGLCLEDF